MFYGDGLWNLAILGSMSAKHAEQIRNKVNTKRLAEYFDVSTRTIGAWRASGILPFTQIGSVVRYDVDECEDALVKYKTKGVTA